jgi:hypothetical protein
VPDVFVSCSCRDSEFVARLAERYMRTVKHHMPRPDDPVAAMVDQSFHVLALFGLAVLGSALS